MRLALTFSMSFLVLVLVLSPLAARYRVAPYASMLGPVWSPMALLDVPSCVPQHSTAQHTGTVRLDRTWHMFACWSLRYVDHAAQHSASTYRTGACSFTTNWSVICSQMRI